MSTSSLRFLVIFNCFSKMEKGKRLVAENLEDEEEVFIPKQVLATLCCMVSFNQLKLLRLVCREWNVQVSTHPRIKNCTGVLRQDWIDKARGLNFESTLKWKSVYFHFFPFKRNWLFTSYWEKTGLNVTKLQMKYTKISCDRMVVFLMSMPHLVDVTFNQCNFEQTRQILPAEDGWRGRRVRVLRCACPHENLVLPEGLVMPPPRIRRLVFNKEDYFPLCVMDLLMARTNGVLEELQFNHARLARWRRVFYRPVPEQVEARVFQIAQRNVNTIRRFSFYRNFRGDLFLTRLRTNNLNFRLESATIGQQASWTHMNTAETFIQYLNSLDAQSLRELTWRFIHRFRGRDLSHAIALKTELRYLFIDSVWCDQEGQNGNNLGQVNFSIALPNLTKLQTLHLRDRNRRKMPSMNTNYLDFLPHSVTSLSFYGYYILDDRISEFVRSVSAQRLKTLVIEGGRYVTNQTMQLIIVTLPQLEVLGINDSRFLTDTGVTGLPEEACKNILYCNQRSILYGDTPLENSDQVSISRMTNLRKLSFAGCRKISDISIFLGIKFPYLQEIDMSRCLNVTDVGLLALARNNQRLERIIVMKNLKVTHFGLNLVLAANEKIANIHTSKKVGNRNLGKQFPYDVVSRYDTAVTYCRWDERRARPMYTD